MTQPDTGYNFGELYDKHGGEAEPLGEGVYEAVVVEAKTKSSSSGAKPQVVIQFKIVDHPKLSNRKLTNTFTVSTDSEAAMNIFFRQMAALGFGGEFWAANPTNPLPTLAAQVVGRRARIQVKMRPYQGVDRPNINNVMPSGGGGPAGLGGLAPVPGGLTPPPPLAAVPPPSPMSQMVQPPAPVAPPVPAAPVPVAPPVAAPAPVAPPVAAPVPVTASVPVTEVPVEVPVAEPAPAVQEQTQAPAPAAPVVEQAPPAPLPEGATTVPPAPAVPF